MVRNALAEDRDGRICLRKTPDCLSNCDVPDGSPRIGRRKRRGRGKKRATRIQPNSARSALYQLLATDFDFYFSTRSKSTFFHFLLNPSE
jgi:hypothetical protein